MKLGDRLAVALASKQAMKEECDGLRAYIKTLLDEIERVQRQEP